MTDIEQEQRRALHWDGTVTAGNVLTAVAMTVAMVVWGLRTEARVDATETRVGRLETARLVDERDTVVMREKIAEMQAQQAAMLRALTRIEVLLDRPRAASLTPAAP